VDTPRPKVNQVFVDHGVVTWPGELDLAPDATLLATMTLKIVPYREKRLGRG